MEEEQDVGGEYEDDYEEDVDDEEGDLAAAGIDAIHSDSSADDLEPDSLAESRIRGAGTGEDSSDSDTVQISREDDSDDVEGGGGDGEIEEVFSRDANSNPVSRTAVSRTAVSVGSRAESIMSRSSISYFVDLQERGDASSSPKPSNPLDSTSTAVMSQSMHAARSASGSGESMQGSSVSFFVDISKNEGNSKEPSFSAAPPQPQPKRRQSLVGYSSSACEETIVALITRAREHLTSALSGPTLTKAAVRRKRLAVTRIEALLSEEESRLRRGEEPSNGNVVDVVLCDSSDQSTPGGGGGGCGGGPNKFHQNPLDEDTKQRPLSAYQQQRHSSISNSGGENQVSVQHGDRHRPVLRREKTFDLEPGANLKDMRVIEIGLGIEDVAISNANQSKTSNKTTDNKTLSRSQIRMLKAFQEQRANFVLQFQSDVETLEKTERELSMKSLNAGLRKVQCWEAKQENSPVRQPRLKQPLDLNPISQKLNSRKMVTRHVKKSQGLDATLAAFAGHRSEERNGVDAESQVSDFRPPPPSPAKTQSASDAVVVPPKPRPRTMIPTPRRPARKCDSFDIELPRGSPSPSPPTTRVADRPVPLQRMTSLACSSRPHSAAAAAAQQRSGSLRVTIVDRRSTSSLTDDADDHPPETAGSAGSCSWFISSEEQQMEANSSASPERENVQHAAGSVLLEKYKERKTAQSQRARQPRAYFVTCDEVEVPVPETRRRRTSPKPKVQLKVFELDKNCQNQVRMDGNLQEALRKRRPDYIERTKIRESDRLARKIVATRGRSVYDPSSAISKKSSTLNRSKNEERSTVNYGGGNTSSKMTPQTRLPTSHCAKAAPKKASTIPTPTKKVGKPLVSPYGGGHSVGLRGRRPLGVPKASCYGSASAETKKDMGSCRKNKSVAGLRSIIS